MFKWTDATGGVGQQLPMSNETLATIDQYAAQIKNDRVFGFERPKVNINEAYLRVENDATDTFPLDPNDMKKKASLPYDMKLWLELHNPVTPATPAEQFSGSEGYPDPAATDDSTHGGYRAALKDTLQGAEKSIYRVLLYKVTPPAVPPGGSGCAMGMRPRPGDDNVAGTPTTATLLKDATNNDLALRFRQGERQQHRGRFRRDSDPTQRWLAIPRSELLPGRPTARSDQRHGQGQASTGRDGGGQYRGQLD